MSQFDFGTSPTRDGGGGLDNDPGGDGGGGASNRPPIIPDITSGGNIGGGPPGGGNPGGFILINNPRPEITPGGGFNDNNPFDIDFGPGGGGGVNPPPPVGPGNPDITNSGGFITIFDTPSFDDGGVDDNPNTVGPAPVNPNLNTGSGRPIDDNPNVIITAPVNPNLDTGSGGPIDDNPNTIIPAPVNPNIDPGSGGNPTQPPRPKNPDIGIGDPPVVVEPDTSTGPNIGVGNPRPPRPVNPFVRVESQAITAARATVNIPFTTPDKTVVSTKNPLFQSPIKNEVNTPLTENLRGDEIIPRIEGGLIFGEFATDVNTPTGGPTLPSQSTDGSVLPGVTFGAETQNPQTRADGQPTDVNYLYQTFFRLQIPMFPKLNYFCQRVTLPGFGTSSPIDRPTRFASLKIPETRVTFDNLEVTFLVDKNLENWREIQNWMKRIYLVKDHKSMLPNSKDHTTDANLVLLNSAMNPNLRILFNNIFPVSLSGLEFDSSVTSMTPFTAVVTFAYDTYEFVDPETGSSL